MFYNTLFQVQSPHGLTQMIGQVIRLPDGQLAQVDIVYNYYRDQKIKWSGDNF